MWIYLPISKSQRSSRALKNFFDMFVKKKRPTIHSSRGTVMLLMVERLEEAGVPYCIKAWPGKGYVIEPLEDMKKEQT